MGKLITTLLGGIVGFITFAAIFFVVALIAGIPVMLLWNAVIPAIFTSVPAITFWQAVGLNLLSAFLIRSAR